MRKEVDFAKFIIINADDVNFKLLREYLKTIYVEVGENEIFIEDEKNEIMRNLIYHLRELSFLNAYNPVVPPDPVNVNIDVKSNYITYPQRISIFTANDSGKKLFLYIKNLLNITDEKSEGDMTIFFINRKVPYACGIINFLNALSRYSQVQTEVYSQKID